MIEFRGRQRDIPSKFLRMIPEQAELKYIEYNNLKNVRNTDREKTPQMVDIHVYEINEQIVKKLQVHDDSKTRNRIKFPLLLMDLFEKKYSLFDLEETKKGA